MTAARPPAPVADNARDGPGTRSWYAVHTQPRAEELAEVHLKRVCEQVFCPRYRQRVILHGYRREVTRPLFPSYLFAAFDVHRDFGLVHYARGVRGVITFGNEPAVVPGELLAGIESRMKDGYVVLQPKPLTPGQRCEITAGPFEGYTGIFLAELSHTERITILLDVLKYNARMVVDRAALRVL